jgi:CSLREA domain-containing protein
MFDSSPRPVKISKPKFLKLDFKVLLILLLSLTFGIYGLSGGIVNAASTIVVTSSGDATADDGVCTLREAITAANDDTASGATAGECIAGSGADTVNFSIPGSGIHRITPTTQLPTITETLNIDGTTQPGTNCEPRNLKIELDFTAAYATQNKARALSFERDVDNNVLQGLSIFGDSDGAAGGGQEDQGITFNKSDGNTVRCNNIGLMADGKRPSVELGYTNNRAGLKLWVGSDNNLIGGNTLADRNIFSDNYEGMSNSCEASGGGNMENLKIVGNYFGTDVTGMVAYPNKFIDASISCGDKIQIGGSSAGERNIFSGSGSAVALSVSSTAGVGPTLGTRIQGNYFGLNAAGEVGVGFAEANSAISIIVLPNSVFGNADSPNTESLIGGNVPGEGNVITGFVSGVNISTGYFDFGGGPIRSAFQPVDNSVIGNKIYGNDFGIELCDLNVGTGTGCLH